MKFLFSTLSLQNKTKPSYCTLNEGRGCSSLTTTATKFGDFVSPSEFWISNPLKTASQWIIQRTLGQSPLNLTFHFYADVPLSSLQSRQRLGVFQEGTGSVLSRWQHAMWAFVEQRRELLEGLTECQGRCNKRTSWVYRQRVLHQLARCT